MLRCFWNLYTTSGASYRINIDFCFEHLMQNLDSFLGSLNDSTPLESIIALLLLSTKYNLGNVRSYVTKQPTEALPNDAS